MTRIEAKKIKMSQIWKGDKVIPVSLLALKDSSQMDILKEGDKVKVTGVTKGKGFQGVVKRYSFAGGPKTHGQKNRYRAAGSIGSTAPQRVLPGRKMAGRMGGNKKSILNLKVVDLNKDKNQVYIKGSVPGNIGSRVLIFKND